MSNFDFNKEFARLSPESQAMVRERQTDGVQYTEQQKQEGMANLKMQDEVKVMVAKLTPAQKTELLRTHGSGLPVERKHAILTQYLAAKQQDPLSVGI